MKVVHRFTYGALDPGAPSDCALCRDGGIWKTKMGAPELRGNTFHHWRPDKEQGCTWDGEDPRDPVSHVIVMHPRLWEKPVLLTDTQIHEWFHVIDHVKRMRKTPGWHLSHAAITRLASAFAEFMHENNLEIVQRRPKLEPIEDAKKVV